MSIFGNSKKSPGVHEWQLGLRIATLLALLLVSTTTFAACELADGAVPQEQQSLTGQYDFFTNYGQYMPRMHCLQTAEGTPDWGWISALIGLNLIVIAGYLRIFHFWRRCYHEEEVRDRDSKLMNLAWIFALCATCGYGFSIIMFFWPIYRLLALALVGLAFITWRFAFDLEPFRKSFTAHMQRLYSESLQRDKADLEAKHQELEIAHREIATAKFELEKTNEDLDEFVYAASHDLKAPLRAISSLAQFVVEDLGENVTEQVQDDLEKMQSRVKRMERMLNGLLHYSRVGRLNYDPETFPVCDAIQQAVAILDIPPTFHIEVADTNLMTTSPRPLLEQVLRNLVDNAVKHHPREDGTISIHAEEAGEFIRFSVKDDGRGIAPDYQEKVFVMFQTLRRRDEFDCSGMGLALVKRIVERHGGEISVESQPGEGATFHFTWPASEKSLHSTIRPPHTIPAKEVTCV